MDIIKFYKSQTRSPLKNTIFLDLSQVEIVHPEAIMYTIALSNSLKTSILRKVNIKGNFPLNEIARKDIMKSGFLNYVNTNVTKISPNNSTIQIISGTNVDATVVARVIDFIKSNSSIDNNTLRNLYTMLIEIMTNTIQHAYNNKQVFKSNWYMYIDVGNGNVNITILDTGDGIPTTVTCKLKDLFYKKDSSKIMSTLNGDFRTETKKDYRGKGLPNILKCYKDTHIKELCIISGKGSVLLCKKTNTKECYDSNEDFYGTVFYISV